jgi:DNA-binding NarL/FixJ family response regulator
MAWIVILPEQPSARNPAVAIHGRTRIPIEKRLEERLRALLRQVRANAQHKRQSNSGASTDPTSKLTERQLQIAGMVKNGDSNKAIANSLDLSVGTVKVHLHRIFEALGVASRMQLAMRINGETAHGETRAQNHIVSRKPARRLRLRRI